MDHLCLTGRWQFNRQQIANIAREILAKCLDGLGFKPFQVVVGVCPIVDRLARNPGVFCDCRYIEQAVLSPLLFANQRRQLAFHSHLSYSLSMMVFHLIKFVKPVMIIGNLE